MLDSCNPTIIEAMDRTYTWDLSWTISFDTPGIKEALEPVLCHLVRALGPHFHRSLIHALVAPYRTLSCSSQRYFGASALDIPPSAFRVYFGSGKPTPPLYCVKVRSSRCRSP